jgi:hypothetical protein
MSYGGSAVSVEDAVGSVGVGGTGMVAGFVSAGGGAGDGVSSCFTFFLALFLFFLALGKISPHPEDIADSGYELLGDYLNVGFCDN